jgi:hypothetical protein
MEDGACLLWMFVDAFVAEEGSQDVMMSSPLAWPVGHYQAGLTYLCCTRSVFK